MNIYISGEDNQIYLSNNASILGFHEYHGNRYQPIMVKPMPSMPITKMLDAMLLLPMTHVINLWHLMHHLFSTYKYIRIHNLDIKDVFPIFFKG